MPPGPPVGLVVGVLALATFLVAGLAVASADEELSYSATFTTRLEPGLNYVGWVSPDTPVEEFFAAVPEVEAVFAWSSRNQSWLQASPHASTEHQSLKWLTPGLGLVVRLGGEQPFDWTRQFSRASGLVSLQSGWNLVAWSGGDATLLSDIERDLQRSFQAQYGDNGPNDPDRLYTPEQPEVVDQDGLIEHGGAFWVHADELGGWKQRSDSTAIIRGRVVGPDGQGIAGLYVRADSQSRHAWYFPYITRSDGSFVMGPTPDMRFIISFEHRSGCSSYYRLNGSTENPDDATIVDTTETVDFIEFQVGDGACGRHIRGRVVDASGAPVVDRFISAHPSISGNGGSDQTAEDGSFEILVPDSVEYKLRVRVKDICDGWYDGSGLTLDREEATAITLSGADVMGVEIRTPAGFCAWELRGRVLRPDGSPYAAVKVSPVSVDNRHVGSVTTAEDGSFRFALREPGQYRLRVWTLDNCDGYYADGQLVTEREDASAIDVSGEQQEEIVLWMPNRFCAWQIRGQLIRSDGTPIADTRVTARGTNSNVKANSLTDANGWFALKLRVDAPFTLSAEVNETCRVYRSDDGISLWHAAATRFRHGDRDLANVEFRLPEGACDFRVQGRIVREDEQPIADALVAVRRDSWIGSTRTDAEGRFEAWLPVNGEYVLRFQVAPGCWAYYEAGTPVILMSDEEPTVGLGGVENLRIRVPASMCAVQVGGVVLNQDGSPRGGAHVVMESTQGVGGVSSGAELDGSFLFTVHFPGSYRLFVVMPNGCRIGYREDGFTFDPEKGDDVWATREGVFNIVIRTTEESCVQKD